MTTLKPIVVVGSINMDLVATADHIPLAGETIHAGTFQTFPGGKGANQAVAVGRLGYPVQMIGMLGQDAFAEPLRASLREAGVDVSRVGEVPGASGVALIVVAKKGENSIVVVAGANACLTPASLDAHAEAIRHAGIVLVQLETPLETVRHLAKLCRQAGVPLVLDPAPAKPLLPGTLEGVAWLTPNETEAAFYAGDTTPERNADNEGTHQALARLGATGVILKLGSRGVYIAGKAQSATQIDAFRVEAIDSVAAGDAFNGAFAVGLMLGKTPAESARFAAAAAAISVTRAGAQASMPTRNEVEAMLEGAAGNPATDSR